MMIGLWSLFHNTLRHSHNQKFKSKDIPTKKSIQLVCKITEVFFLQNRKYYVLGRKKNKKHPQLSKYTKTNTSGILDIILMFFIVLIDFERGQFVNKGICN